MTEDQKIYQKIGELLWSIMHDEAQKVTYSGFLYPDFKGYRSRWFTKDNDEKGFNIGFDNPIEGVEKELESLINDLQKCDLFAKEPWTHFEASLNEECSFKIQFAYIPAEDSWPSLHMRGISDLTEEEAEHIYYVPKEIWEERVRLKNDTN